MTTVSAIFAYHKAPVSVLLFLIYSIIILSILFTDELPSIPSNLGDLDVNKAYADLHKITERPHPYHSHANDFVRDYIISTLQPLADIDGVTLKDDVYSNVTVLKERGVGLYFEGNNILVKIDGKEPSLPGVLFSAHFDSVSTAPGATDDGMGVVTLLALIRYFTLPEHRPLRTAIFNINNGEEDGLHGALAFMSHPWSNITSVFLNLEGASSGGRPILFRSSNNKRLLNAWKTVPHPHANIISKDGFNAGLIQSGTDFSVYTRNGRMDGLDFAFYRGRSWYHTRYDAVRYTEGGKKALYSMMETSVAAGSALLSSNDTFTGYEKPTVYFELFASYLFVMDLSTLFVINAVFLSAGPFIIIVLLFGSYAMKFRRQSLQSRSEGNSTGPQELATWQSILLDPIGPARLIWLWPHMQFWLALTTSVLVQIFFMIVVFRLNRYIVHSHPYMVTSTAFLLSLLASTAILSLPISANISPDSHKTSLLMQNYIASWLALLANTIIIAKLELGSGYVITIWNICMWLAVVIGVLQGMFTTEPESPKPSHDEPLDQVIDGSNHEDENHEQENLNERTPLIARSQRLEVLDKGRAETGALGWWIAQMLITTVIPLVLFSHIGIMLLGALTQTLPDPGSPVAVYAFVSLLALFMTIPVIPYLAKLHPYFIAALVIALILAMSETLLAISFTSDAPMKTYFQQTLQLAQDGSIQIEQTTLHGLEAYLPKRIIPHIPSAASGPIFCTDSTRNLLFMQCSWPNLPEMMPSPGGGFNTTWITTNITRANATSVHFSITPTNSRACRILFDTPSVISFAVKGSRSSYTTEKQDEALVELRLWSRTWERTFEVDITHEEGSNIPFSGRVLCEWVEYESSMAGLPTAQAHLSSSGIAKRETSKSLNGPRFTAKIPAFEEVLRSLPRWATVVKASDGLVQAWITFTI